MYIFKIILHEFNERIHVNINDLCKYNIKEDLIDDSILQFPSEINIDHEYHLQMYGFKLCKGEIINYVLHRNVWRSLIQMNKPWAMIIENNVHINTSFGKIINTIDTIPKGWDIFFPYNASEYYELNMKNQGMSLLNPNLRENRHIDPFLLGFHWSNSCYFISRKGAEKLLQINTINDRLDDSILRLSYDEKLNTYTENVEWFDFNNIVRWEYPERKQNIWDLILENSPWTDTRRARVNELLHVISNLAHELSIDLVLQGGTHLGYIRHGGIMPWDDDVDIGIEEKMVDLFFNALTDYGKGYCFGKFIEPGTNTLFYKVWHEDGESINDHEYTFPFIDIWIYNICNNDLIFKNGIICKESAKRNLMPVIFENSEFKIPFNSIDVLDTRYIDWKTKIRVYSHSHRLEKSAFHPLTLSIKVTKEGRLLSWES